jgi:HD-like signal output (HDOD) protein
VALAAQLEDLLERLPTLPEIPLEISKRIEDPENSDIREIARLASQDAVISAHLLRLANSALFGGGARTETVADAITRLGLTETRKLVLTVALVQTFNQDSKAFDIRRFWTFGLASALCAERIARDLHYVAPARAYLAGLVHRIGDAALALGWPARFEEAIRYSQEPGKTLDNGIEKSFHVTAAALCAGALQRWNFPNVIVDAVEYQANPEESPTGGPLPWMVFISHRLCQIVGVGFETAPQDDFDWVGEVPAEFAAQLFAEAEGDWQSYVGERWGFLQDVKELVNGLFLSSGTGGS